MRRDILTPLRVLHGRLRDFRVILWPRIRERLLRPHAVFLVLTPEHGNLGDHAIALAEIRLLRELGIDCMEITAKQLGYLRSRGWLGVMDGRPIFVNGGGYLGTLWPEAEALLRDVVQNNPRSRILLFPNTVYCEDSEPSGEDQQKTARVFRDHRHLTVFAREKASYGFLRARYAAVGLSPDMVLTLDGILPVGDRSGCLLCLRQDRERTRTPVQEGLLRQQVRSLFGEAVRDTDLVLPGSIPAEKREQAVEAKLREFARAGLVVTDRLHGMLFCAVTGTPCVVIDSKSPKMRGCYEWIRHLGYIRFAEDASRVAEAFRRIPPGEHRYDSALLGPLFAPLRKAVGDAARGGREGRG